MVGLSIHKFVQAFLGRSINPIRGLYSRYCWFQIATNCRGIIMSWTPIRLVWMCTLPNVANPMAHILSPMNKMLKDCILEITMSFLACIPIKARRRRRRRRRWWWWNLGLGFVHTFQILIFFIRVDFIHISD